MPAERWTCLLSMRVHLQRRERHVIEKPKSIGLSKREDVCVNRPVSCPELAATSV